MWLEKPISIVVMLRIFFLPITAKGGFYAVYTVYASSFLYEVVSLVIGCSVPGQILLGLTQKLFTSRLVNPIGNLTQHKPYQEYTDPNSKPNLTLNTFLHDG